MAEAILKQKSPELNVQSAGIYANENDDASPLTIQILQRNDIIFEHQAQLVTDDLLDWADYVFAMTVSHKQRLISQYSIHKNKIHLLKEFINDPEQRIQINVEEKYEELQYKKDLFDQKNEHLSDHEYEQKLNEYLANDLTEFYILQNQLQDTDVSDPFGGNIDVYKTTYDELNQLIEKLIERLNLKGGK